MKTMMVGDEVHQITLSDSEIKTIQYCLDRVWEEDSKSDVNCIQTRCNVLQEIKQELTRAEESKAVRVSNA